MSSVVGPAIVTFLIFLTVSWLVVRIFAPATVRLLLAQVGLTCLVLTALTTVYTEDPGMAIVTGIGSGVIVYAILRLSRRRMLSGQEEDSEALSLHDALMPEQGTAEAPAADSRADAPTELPPTLPPALPPPLGTGPATWPDQARARPGATPGMRAAGLILLANAAAFTAIATLDAAAGDDGGSRVLLATAIADLIIGAGLLSGGEVWIRWATGRAIVTGLLFGVLQPMTGDDFGWAGAIPQIVLSIGIIYLVRLRGADRRRLVLGIFAVALAWSGALAGSVSPGIFPLGGSAEIRTSPSGGLFRDEALGLRLDLPAGWQVLPASRLAGSLPGTRMMAVHPRSSSTAALVIESDLPAMSIDAYLDRVVQEHRKTTTSIVDVGRAGAQIGGHEARRMMVRWQENDATVVGVITACREGARYFRLETWGPELMTPVALRASQDLASGLLILPAGQDDPEAMALRLTDRMPNVSVRGARLLVEEMQRRRIAAADTQRFAGEALRVGLGLLRPPEKSEWDRLTRVPPKDLSPASQRRLRALGDKAIEAALRQGKAAEQGRKVGRAGASGPALPSPTPAAGR